VLSIGDFFNSKKYIVALVFSSVLGSSFWAVPFIGGFQLSLYRLMMIFVCMFFFLFKTKPIIIKSANKRYLFFYLLLIIYAVFSVLWCIDTAFCLKSVLYLLTGLVAFLFFQQLNDKYVFLTVIKSYAMALFVIVVLAWYECLTSQYFFVTDPGRKAVLLRTRTPELWFGHVNDFSLFLIIGMSCCLTLYKMHKGIFRFLFLMLYVSTVALIIYGGSRSMAVAMLFGLIAWFVIGHVRNKHRKKRIFLYIVIALIVEMLFSAYYEKIFDAVNQYMNLDAFYKGSSNYIRLNQLRSGLYMIQTSFGFGVGAGNSNVINYYPYDVNGISNLHNFWIQIFADYGVFFGIMNVLGYLGLVYKLYHIYKSTPDNQTAEIARLLFAVMVAFSIGFIGPSSIISHEWLWCFWGITLSFVGNYYFQSATKHKYILKASLNLIAEKKNNDLVK